MNTTTSTQPLRRTHLEIAKKLQRAQVKQFIGTSPRMFNIGRGRTFYNVALLEELQAHEIVSSDNRLTDKGQLWILMNEIF